MYLYGTRQLADSMRAVRQNTILIAEQGQSTVVSIMNPTVGLH